jgi:predicted enzyme related to lactoylglutathione lyase
MLQGRHMHPTIPAADLERARSFYEAGGGSWFLLYPTPSAGTARHTVAGWAVEDLDAEVAELKARGVVFEEYDSPQLKTVDGIATTAAGRAAWFKDSEGNILGLVQLG